MRRRKVVFCGILVLLVLVLGEVAARLVLGRVMKAEFWHPDTVLFHFYPEMRKPMTISIRRADDFYDVLLIGGSVLHASWGNVATILQQDLPAAVGRKVRIHNVAWPAHMSWDSRFKYRLLEDQEFDLVVTYDGINDLRANHCSESEFRLDYSHMMWYQQLGRIESHRELKLVALPYTLSFAGLFITTRFGWTHYYSAQSTGGPEAPSCGERSGQAVRHNLTEILDLAARKHETVALCTFAYYVAPGYSLEKFNSKELDYGLHRSAAELWGSPEEVTRGLDAHNTVIHDLARGQSNVFLVDQNQRIPKNGAHFDDVCHLTALGSKAFVTNLLDALRAHQGQ